MSSPYWLRCRSCGTRAEPGDLRYQCEACGGEQVVEYSHLGPPDASASGVWRYRSRLPVPADAVAVSLGEGATPLIPLSSRLTARAGVRDVRMKCEHLNPTGSFKDRIATVAVTIASDRGLKGLAGTSSGNGGAAAAAYCAMADLPLRLFALSSIPDEKLVQLSALGAEAYLVDGIGHDASSTERAARTVAAFAAEHDVFPFLTGGSFSPEAMEGAKTIAYELAEECPEATMVYVPVGGGGLLSAIGRGYAELRGAGAPAPRIVAVQPSGCPTLRHALDDSPAHDLVSTTRISGLQVAVLFDPVGAVDAVRGSGGHLTEVTDDEVAAAQLSLARESGLLVEPAGATAFAGFLQDAGAGRVGEDDVVVVLGTGAGGKDLEALRRIAPSAGVQRIEVSEIEEVLS
ncbi:UNVERIFIED_CONTAM: pyridoxal-phosphate dependent enzyme [Microbacterium sp. SLM126]